MIEKIKSNFKKLFHSNKPPILFFAPEGINIIGDSIDENGGYILSTILDKGVFAAISQREDSIIRINYLNFKEQIEFTTEDFYFTSKSKWAKYFYAILSEINNTNKTLEFGFDLLLSNDLPENNATQGLEALEVVCTMALNNIYKLNLSAEALVKLCTKAEKNYLNVCGSSAQKFTILKGKKNQAIFIDKSTLKYEYFTLKSNDFELYIVNSGKQNLVYANILKERKKECAQAFNILNKHIESKYLSTIQAGVFEDNKGKIKDSILARRAWHVIYENQRVLYAKHFLKVHDYKAFGQLLNQSQMSLKRDFETSNPEIDSLIEAAWSLQYILGARSSDFGKSESLIVFVKSQFVEQFEKELAEKYSKLTKRKAYFHHISVGKEAIGMI